jgi:hypothetical protein
MDFSAIQETINKIDGVITTKVVSEGDIIQEVHILANKLRAPKQIVRDIESSLLALFDYRIDRKVISIAQIQTDDYKTIKRIIFDGISFITSGNTVECSVSLIYDEEEYSATQTAVKTTANKRKVVAAAAIKAVEDILKHAFIFDIQDVLINNSKDITVISVLVNIIEDENEEMTVGSAIVKNDVNEAIVKATLDAVNRRVHKNNF